ncbi:MAG: hypothetical protein IPM29_23155 [Planctomycetes bacterium]|nr:hypothetical protein [Planctomycetota bacterium]
MRALLAAVALPFASLAAQQVDVLQVAKGEALRVQVAQLGGGRTLGGYGHLRVDVDSSASSAQTLDAVLASLQGSRVRIERTLTVEPGERGRLFVPLPALDEYLSFEVRLRSTGDRIQRSIGVATPGGSSWSLLFVSQRARDEAGWVAALSARGGGRCQSMQLAARDLPSAWWLSSNADLAVVDGRDDGLDPERQRVLCDLLRAGCPLLVAHGAQLPPGPLRELALEPGMRRVGFGRLLALGEAASARAPGWLAEAQLTWLAPVPLVTLPTGPAPAVMRGVLAIPGLGEVPIRGFLLLIVVFAVAAGPVNYFLLQRRRRQGLLLVTVPALGFGVTVLVLGYGLLSEGLGGVASLRTITQLDQRTHTAASIVQRTVYAGFAPARLTPAPGTLLAPGGTRPSLSESIVLASHRDGSFEGGLVPSRTPVTLSSTSVLPARARLRFRRSGADGLDLLPDATFRPLPRVQTVLLRDFAGRLFCNAQGPDRLELVDEAQAPAVLAAIRAGLGLASAGTPFGSEPAPELVDWVRPSAGGEHTLLEPGEYVALTGVPPVLDDLGIDPRLVRQGHVVIGRLDPEDLVD